MDLTWLLLRTLLLAFGIVALVIALTRLNGLRSFSKFSAFDFAITVAIGTVLAAAINTPSVDAWLTMLALFAVQASVALARWLSPRFADAVDNDPLMLMEDGRVLDGNLRTAKMTRADLAAKLRESGVTRLDRVRAVVFESAGTVSVLIGEGSEDEVEDALIADVRRQPGDHTASGNDALR